MTGCKRIPFWCFQLYSFFVWFSQIFKGELSWSESAMITVDNQIELKKLCGFKKKSKSKDCVERILEHFSFLWWRHRGTYVRSRTLFAYISHTNWTLRDELLKHQKNTHFPWKLHPGTEKDRWIRIWSQILESLKATGWIFGILWRHNHHRLEEKPHTFMPPGNYIGGNVFAEISFVGFELSKISFISLQGSW